MDATVTRIPGRNAGQRLKYLRSERGWTQEKLALISGVSTWVITRLEAINRIPALPRQFKLARAFNVEREAIFGKRVAK
jgi:transcriptional regulator with XRE-family HTH domain